MFASSFELVALLVLMNILLRGYLRWEGSKNALFNSIFYGISIFFAVYPSIGEIADLSGLSHQCWTSMNSKFKSLLICLVMQIKTKQKNQPIKKVPKQDKKPHPLQKTNNKQKPRKLIGAAYKADREGCIHRLH